MTDQANIATISPDKIAILDFDGAALHVDCPGGWEDVQKLTKLVLEYKGKFFVWSGWNSDRNVSFFKVDRRKFATIKSR